uniref:Reverse transcriptase domain-containing protein n=1 Tax=Tanacetum cinerariifolium TaxID=118510 RepID=A0A6L2LLH1_TANCI|nr:hypothetical protein [Tanacetum cinerariifolium]
MPRSIYEYLKLANLEGATMSLEMNDMTQQETLGTVKNVLVKIDKFEFPCDFVVTDMPENLGEMIILRRPFLETIHAHMNVFQEEISLGIGEDRINFDVNGNSRQSNITIEKIYMDIIIYDTIDPHNEISRQTNPLLDKGGLTKRWHVCKPVLVFYDDGSGEDYGMWPTCDPDSIKGSCMGFTDVLQVRYKNQRIDDTTREQRYYEWVAQNYEFDNNRTSSNATMFEKCPYKTNYPTPIPLDKWDKCHITCTWGHTNIYDSDREIMFNEWILDSFDVEEEYAKKIRNPYSQRFDEYKQVFGNEVENLSNEYTLRIRKKGNKEKEPWRSGNEKTNYEPPFVDVKTFEVKKYSFKRGQSFICITKQDDDALPLGRVNGARFKAMIRKELKDKGIPHDETFQQLGGNFETDSIRNFVGKFVELAAVTA